jgi:hypothetical protein
MCLVSDVLRMFHVLQRCKSRAVSQKANQ